MLREASGVFWAWGQLPAIRSLSRTFQKNHRAVGSGGCSFLVISPEKASPGSHDTFYRRSQDPRTVGLWLCSLNADRTLRSVSPDLGAPRWSLSSLRRCPPPTTGVAERDLEGNSVDPPRHVLDSDTRWVLGPQPCGRVMRTVYQTEAEEEVAHFPTGPLDAMGGWSSPWAWEVRRKN